MRDDDNRTWVVMQRRQRANRDLARAEIESGCRLVENEQFGLGHERTTDQCACPLPLGESTELLAGKVCDAEIFHESARAGVFVGCIGVLPTAGRRAERGDHDVKRVFERRKRARQLRRAQSDQVAVREHVDLAKAPSEHVDVAGCGERACAHHRDQARFANAVRPEQNPFLAASDLQIHVIHDHTAIPSQMHVVHGQRPCFAVQSFHCTPI